MAAVMEEALAETWPASRGSFPAQAWRESVAAYIKASTGIQTAEQMLWLTEQIRAAGGAPESLWTYKDRYRARLLQTIASRLEQLERRQVSADTFLVAGARRALETFRSAGYTLFLASGTDDEDVRHEADLLGLTPYFAEIRGAQDRSLDNPKEQLMEEILREIGGRATRRVVIGDGPVEIRLGRQYGAVAVGIASDESGQRPRDPAKVERLTNAGAHVIFDDFSCPELILQVIDREAARG